MKKIRFLYLVLSQTRKFHLWLMLGILLPLAVPAFAATTPSTTVLTSSVSPSNFGQNTVLTATVTGSSPTGTVTFYNGSTSIGTITIASGKATLNINSLPVGSNSLSAIYGGNTGNSASTSDTLIQTVNPSTTVVVVTASPTSSNSGQKVTFTANVTGNNTPTGTVKFYDGSTLLTNNYGVSVFTVGTSGNAYFSTTSGSTGPYNYYINSLAIGTHTITAVYSGDGNNPGVTSPPITLTVNPSITAATVTSSLSTSNFGQEVTFTANVTGNNTPTGTVRFYDGSTLLTNSYGTNTFAVGSSGNAYFSAQGSGATSPYTNYINSLAVGAHTITAVYSGDGNNPGFTSPPITLTVNPSITTVALNSVTPNPSVLGQSVTFTALVVGNNTPTGTVSFYDGATLLKNNYSSGISSFAVAANGAAYFSGTGGALPGTYSISSLSVGAHTITVRYSGDGNNPAVVSSPITLVVAAVNSTASVSAVTPSPANFGQAVTFTALITGNNTLTGSVRFYDGATLLTNNVGVSVFTLGSGGYAYFSSASGSSDAGSNYINTLSANIHNITARYSGDINNPAAVSSAVTLTVNAATTTVAVSSISPSSPNYGQAVTIAASVGGNNGPSGNVTFYSGSTAIGTAALTSGVATITTSTLAAGANNITAHYSGDANNPATDSSVVSLTVNPLVTTNTTSVSASSINVGNSVTLKATILGGLNLTGTVTFKDGATVLGTATVAGGIATFNLSTLTTGPHSITTVYSGDTNNLTSISAGVSLAVKSTSVVTVPTSVPSIAFGGSVVLTASVSGYSPTGFITFMDGANAVGNASLTSGVATFTYNPTVAGIHQITASYAGDSLNQPSQSTSASNVVVSGLNIGLTPSNITVGESAVFSASVVGFSPSGTVTFMCGDVILQSVALSGGSASVSINTLPVGSYAITASYSGDVNNAAVTSAAQVLQVTAALGISPMTWSFGFDPLNRPTTVVDPIGQATYTYYDSLGRPIQVQQPANTGSSTPTITSLSYTLSDSLTTVIDPRNLTTTYASSGIGKLAAQSSPDSGVSEFTYDANGNVQTITDARGKVTSMTYDTLDRLVNVAYPVGTGVSLTYGSIVGQIGLLTSVVDESGSMAYSYDSLGRLRTKTQTTNGKAFVTNYIYGIGGSSLGKVVSITYPSGNQVNYGYDQYGQVSSVSVNPVNSNGAGTSGTVVVLLSGLATNASSQVTGWSWASGNARTMSYDSHGQLVSYNLGNASGTGSSAGAQRTVSYDPAGRITGFSHTNNGASVAALDQSFGYDNLNRLLSATSSTSSTQYSYDANGNRTSKTINATSYANTVSPTSNRLTQTQDVTGTASISFDAAGHITGDGTNTYAYSDRGRMASTTTPGGTVSYSYNALELRVSKTGPTSLMPTGAAYYVYDEAGNLLGEYDANQNAIYETIYLGNPAAALPVGVMVQTGTAAGSNLTTNLYNVYADHTNTPRVITRQSDEAIVWRWDSSEAFGGTMPDQNPNGLGTFVFNQRFPGQVFDAETGLSDNWNRTYDARLGRYRQSDPIGLAGGINTYGYVDGSPVMLFDPYGLWAFGDPLPQGVVDAAAGFGDSMTMNGTNIVRDLLDANGAVNRCSRAYQNGELADIAFETGTMGLSAVLKQMAKNASRAAVRAEFRAATRNIPRNGGELHHNNPLFGHPGGAPTTFPTGGLPASVHSSSANMTMMGDKAAHIAAHSRLQGQEAAVEALLMKPALSGARAAKDVAQSCGCP